MSRVPKAHYFSIRKVKTKNSTVFLAKDGRSMSCSLFLHPFILPSPPTKWYLVDQLEAHCNIYWSFAWTGSIEDAHLDEQLGDHQNLKQLQAHFWVCLCSESYKELRQFGTISRKFSEAQVTCPEKKMSNSFQHMLASHSKSMVCQHWCPRLSLSVYLFKVIN